MSDAGLAVPASASRVGTGRNPVQLFVRDVLGCTCPEEILAQIHCRSGVPLAGLTTRRRLDVGGRLLVYVLEAAGEEALAHLPALVTAGRRERDAQGFNRLRLVLMAEPPEALRVSAERVFRACTAGDERLHLHVLAAELPEVPCDS